VKGYSFYWARCDAAGAACTAIVGARGVSYTLTAADVGKTLRVTVIATNRNGSTVASSQPTAVVVAALATPPAPPPPTSPPPPPPSPPPPDPDTSIQSLLCWNGQTSCQDGNNNGGESLSLTYSTSNADTAQVSKDGGPWQPIGPSPAPVWLDSSCSARTVRVRAVRTTDGAVDPTPASVTTTITPYGGCASAPAPSLSPPAPSPSPTPDGRWYSSTSAFNKPIPSGTPYHPADAVFMTDFKARCGGCTGPSLGSAPPIYLVSSSTPLVTVRRNYPTCNAAVYQVPIPLGAKSSIQFSSGDVESRLNVLVRDSGVEWDMYKITPPGMTPMTENSVQCPANTDWNALIVHKSDPAAGQSGWIGNGSEYSNRAAGVLDGTGTIRPRDTKQPAGSAWDHALAMSYSAILNGARVWPATSPGASGCFNTSICLPYGARLQLDPSFDCTHTTLIPAEKEWLRQLCRTLQTYGVILIDTSCHWPCSGGAIMSENPYSVRQNRTDVDGGGNYTFPYDGSGPAGWGYLPLGVLQHMHVIDWTKWTGA
jgi:hypothetical protein